MTFYNTQILPAKGLTGTSTTETAALSNKINIGIEPGAGEITARVDDTLTLDIIPRDGSPKWVEMNWIAGSDVLCRHPSVILRFGASCARDSWVHLALRLHYKDRFEDVFAQQRIQLRQTPDIYEATYHLTPRQIKDCSAVDLQVFFEPRANSISVHSLSLTAFN